MDRITIVLVLLVLQISCNTLSKSGITPPPEVQSVIQELESTDNVSNTLKDRVVTVLNQCSDYSQNLYELSNKQVLTIQGLKDEITSLKEELSTWRFIKGTFWLAVVLLVAYSAIRLYLKLKPM